MLSNFKNGHGLSSFHPSPSNVLAASSSLPYTEADINNQYLQSLPPGYVFAPTDPELINDYLSRKVHGQNLPINNIKEADIYKYNPQELASVTGKGEDKDLYFFSPRTKRYPHGKRPSRTAGDGHWYASGAEKKIFDDDKLIGVKMALAFYTGKEKGKGKGKGTKTEWLMYEYRLPNKEEEEECRSGKTHEDDMQLDKWVLCRIYQTKTGKKTKAGGSLGYSGENPNPQKKTCRNSYEHNEAGGSLGNNFNEYGTHEDENSDLMFDVGDLEADDYSKLLESLLTDHMPIANPSAAYSMGMTDHCYDNNHPMIQAGEAVTIVQNDFSADFLLAS